MKDSDWVIHILNRVDRYAEDSRVAAVRAREAAASAKRIGWLDPDGGGWAITPEIRNPLENSLTGRKTVRLLEGLAYVLEETNKLLEEARRLGEPVPHEAVEALKAKFKEMSGEE